MGGGGAPSPQVIQAPAAPPNPDIDPKKVQQLADIASQRYQTEVVTPYVQQLGEEQQAQIPLEWGTTGFYPEQQQEYAQTATAGLQDLYSQSSISAELAAQQSMFQAGLANLQSLTAAAGQRAQLQAAQYQAYSQAVPQMAMGFSNLFGNNNQQQQQIQQPQQGQGPMAFPGSNPAGGGII